MNPVRNSINLDENIRLIWLLHPNQARAISIFRANPYPEVTDLICRLPLPTLIYRLETLHLGDQLRISVRSVKNLRSPSIDFQGPRGEYRHNNKCHALLNFLPYLSSKDFHGNMFMKQKRKLFRYIPTASLWRFLLPGWIYYLKSNNIQSVKRILNRLRNWNRIPFRSQFKSYIIYK